MVKWGRIAAGIATVALVVLAAVLLSQFGGVQELRQFVRDTGVWGPLLFVLLESVITIAPVPRTIFIVAGGVIFGPVGIVLVLAATLVGGSLAFWLVRYVGGAFVERHAEHTAVAWVRARIERRGLLAMLSLRLIPVVPFSVFNYAAALTGVRYLYFAIGTVLGSLPGTITMVVLGDAAVGGNPPPALIAVSVVSGIAGVVGAVVAMRRPAVDAPELEPAR